MGLIPWRNKQKVPVQKAPLQNETLEHDLRTSQFRREVDRLFANFFENSPGFFADSLEEFGLARWNPELDVKEDEQKVTVVLEVPGMEAEDISISSSGTVLHIQGKKREEKEDSAANYYHCERRFGSFHRSVELPINTDIDSIQAEYRKGVLTITANKAAGTERKPIPIFAR